MFEKLKKYLNDYSKEIDEHPQQEYDKNLRDLWEKNAELAIKIYGILNVRYISLNRIEDIPEEHRESYKDRANCVFDNMEALISYAHFTTERPGDIVADRDYSLDVLKSILSENYKPPKEIEDALKHLLTVHFLFNHLMPTTPGLPHIISLRAGHALALLAGSALIKSSIADHKGAVEYQRGRQKKTDDKKEADMLDLISQVYEGLNTNKYRKPDGKIKYYSMAGEIQKRFKEEKIKNRLGEINKKYKNGTKTPDRETVVKYLKIITLKKSEKVTF